jgi:hypothetical protein
MFSWLKYLNSFISRKVRRQNMEWSNGVIFLIATFCPEGLWMAELSNGQRTFAFRYDMCTIPDYSIRAFTDDILNVILLRYIEGDLSRTRRWSSLCHLGGGSLLLSSSRCLTAVLTLLIYCR